MDRWLKNLTLIGEAKSLDHLGHMPTLISIHCEHRPSVKYIGGMLALLSFESTVEAREFLENERNWTGTFKWLKMGSPEVNNKFERVTWIRLVGLPLRLWSNTNFSSIVGKFGKIVVPLDHITNRVDLSVAKIAITTEKLTKFNEEILVEADGQYYQVGIIEYEDEPWFPFKFDEEEQPYADSDREGKDESMISESENSDSNDDEEGVSGTWINDIEEGEIAQEDTINPPSSGGVGLPPPTTVAG
ncbi:unnamed protein product [Lactuca saligna]|uniref:DUF4283 domain-containing protein n=1 Tax=Lactuca saligna TaxID=75948 RepID=A0AA35Y6H9_LACSI|nr:unnamed protein product [Lactuca saligna]